MACSNSITGASGMQIFLYREEQEEVRLYVQSRSRKAMVEQKMARFEAALKVLSEGLLRPRT